MALGFDQSEQHSEEPGPAVIRPWQATAELALSSSARIAARPDRRRRRRKRRLLSCELCQHASPGAQTNGVFFFFFSIKCQLLVTRIFFENCQTMGCFLSGINETFLSLMISLSKLKTTETGKTRALSPPSQTESHHPL